MNFGKAIRIVRSIADVSQGELAAKSSLDRSYLSLIESEKRKPTVETLQRISSALNIPFHLLTLLATEREDAKHINEGQVQGLATELTRLLLKGEKDNERASHKANSGKSERSGASSRNKKKRAA
ncbi:MAG: helix-turn-helix domain-containing protein [Terracidiphilus sp.]